MITDIQRNINIWNSINRAEALTASGGFADNAALTFAAAVDTAELGFDKVENFFGIDSTFEATNAADTYANQTTAPGLTKQQIQDYAETAEVNAPIIDTAAGQTLDTLANGALSLTNILTSPYTYVAIASVIGVAYVIAKTRN